MNSDSNKLRTLPAIKWSLIVLAVGISYLGLTILEGELFNTHYTTWAYGLFLMAASFYVSRMLRAWIFALLGFIVGTAAWHYELAIHMTTPFTRTTFNLHLLVMTLTIFTGIPLMLIRKKRQELFSRELFELAASPVEETDGGFTTRPYPAGKASSDREALLGFARLLEKKKISRPLIDETGVVIPITTGRAQAGYPGSASMDDTSYVAIDYQGQVTVFVHGEDYKQYRHRFTFNQLCDSMGDLFKTMLVQYHEGDEAGVLRMITNLRTRRIETLYWIFQVAGFVLFGLFVLFYFIRLK